MCLDSLFDSFYVYHCLHVSFFCVRIYASECLCKEAFPEVLTFTLDFIPVNFNVVKEHLFILLPHL